MFYKFQSLPIRRVLRCSALIFLLALLSGCAGTAAKQVVPKFTYQKPITTRVNKDLLLSWKTGYVVPSDSSIGFMGSASPGLVGAVADLTGLAIVEYHNRHPNPADRYQFGEYRQAILMRALYHALVKNKVFKSVRVIYSPGKLKLNQVAMTLNFASSKVTFDSLITLDVHITLRSRRGVIKKVLFIQPTKANLPRGSKYTAFEKQQVAVTNLLIEGVIRFIQKNKNFLLKR